MKTLIVVDMIHDFVYGKFGSEDARRIVPTIKALTENFETVVYLKDSHDPSDPEIAVWGEHAMKHTPASDIIPELDTTSGHIIEKHTYDGFLGTELHNILKEKGITDVYLCGVATDICVLHTAFGAFARGYKVHIIEDACAGTSRDAHDYAVKYMNRIYGAKIHRSDDL